MIINLTTCHVIATVLFLLGSAISVPAQPVLTEADVVKETIEKNLSVEALKLRKQSSVLSSHTARGQWLPRLSVSIEQDYTPLDSTSASIGDSLREGDKKTSTRAGVALGATQALPGGGRLSAGVDLNRLESFGEERPLIDGDPASALSADPDLPDHSNGWSVEYQQPLLRNAWGNDPVRSSIYIQRLDHQRLTLDQKQQIISLISEARGQYWELFELRSLIRLYETQKASAQQRLTADRAKLAVGRATPLDTLNAALEFMKTQTQIMRLEGDISLARHRLANILNRDTLDAPIAITDSISLSSLPASDELLRQAMEYDPQLKIFSVMHEKLSHQKSRARNELLPQVDLSATYRRGGRDSDFLGNDRLFEQNLVLALIAEYSIPTRGRKNDLRISEIQLQENKLQEKQRRDQIQLQIDQLCIAWEKELSTIDVLKKTKEIARRQLQASQTGYRLGTVDRLSLVDAENAYLSASVDLLRSQLTMKRTQIVLDEVTGTVLPTFGVVLQ
ncbi:MAG: TolC family protein [Fibrobacterota bacterium]